MLFGLGGGKTAVGLDISSDTVKAVQLKQTRRGVSLANLGMGKLSPSPIADEISEARTDLTAKAIKRVLGQNKIKTKSVYTSVGGTSVVVRYIVLPYMTQKELRDVIRFEAEGYIPFDVRQVVLDCEILREFVERGEKKIEVLLVAAKEEIIGQHMEIMKKVNLKPLAINVDTFAVEDSWELSGSSGIKEENEIIALIDIGARVTNINIIERKRSSFNRDVLVGGNDFTKAIAGDLGVDFQAAEALKEEQGRISMEGEVETAALEGDRTSRINEAIGTVAAKLLGELDRSFVYYYAHTQIHKKTINRVVLNGGSSRLPNLDRFLSNGLGIPVEINNPFKRIHIDTANVDPKYISKVAPAFAVSAGLALRGLLGYEKG